jgi:TM2 domain-containing membrane protein YozV
MNGATTMNQELESPSIETPAGPAARSYARVDPHERFVDDPRRKSALTAAILSAMPGLGQIYVGYYQQGFVHALTVAGLIAIIASGVIDSDIVGVVGFLLAFFWLYNVIDAARRASLYNQALSGLRPMDLPEDTRRSRSVGSLAGGVALIAGGLVLFGHTMFGMSLDWVSQWWPMAIVGAGAWLVYEDRRLKRART